jgi:hypothetical protein
VQKILLINAIHGMTQVMEDGSAIIWYSPEKEIKN